MHVHEMVLLYVLKLYVLKYVVKFRELDARILVEEANELKECPLNGMYRFYIIYFLHNNCMNLIQLAFCCLKQETLL